MEEKRLSDAHSAQTSVEGKLDLRTKQFSLLMSTIQNLKATLDEDVAMDEEEDEQVKRGDHDDEDMDESGKHTQESGHDDGEVWIRLHHRLAIFDAKF